VVWGAGRTVRVVRLEIPIVACLLVSQARVGGCYDGSQAPGTCYRLVSCSERHHGSMNPSDLESDIKVAQLGRVDSGQKFAPEQKLFALGQMCSTRGCCRIAPLRTNERKFVSVQTSFASGQTYSPHIG